LVGVCSIRPLAVCALFAALSAPVVAHAATLQVISADGPSEGLNDPTPVTPVGGNSGTTLGAQRRLALERAASIWGAALKSPVPIRILASFDPLSCTATSAVLGSAGATGFWRDFAGAVWGDTWYPSALANALTGFDLDPSHDEIQMYLNSGLGQSSCLEGAPFYLGLDGQGGGVDLINVVLHEFSHGLGFLTFLDSTTGAEFGGSPDIFENSIVDLPTGEAFPDLTAAERVAAIQHAQAIVFSGTQTKAAAAVTLAPGAPVVSLGTLGQVLVGPADFGPPLSSPPIVGPVVAALDSGTSTTDACQTLTSSVAGKVALVDRGSCSYFQKVQRLQGAGALAVLIADNVAGTPPPPLSGGDSTITIPAVMITQATGAALRSLLGEGPVTASLGANFGQRIGADPMNRPFLYAPSPYSPGSSLSHFDRLATPNLLMEPNITANPGHSLDLTPSVMADLGWPLATPAAAPALGGNWLLLTTGVLLAWIGLSRRPRRSGP